MSRFIFAVVLAVSSSVAAGVEPPPPGTLLVTRNSAAVGNETPGYWNHVAIAVQNGWVVEAQEGLGVIAVPFDTFFLRYPEIVAFRVVPPGFGPGVAAAAVRQLGAPYRRVGNNCVSVVRRSVEGTTRRNLRWRRPDHVVRAAQVIYWRKSEQIPTLAEKFHGATTNPAHIKRSAQREPWPLLETPE